MPKTKYNGVQVQPTLGTTCDNATPILVRNLSAYPLTIRKGTILATFEPMPNIESDMTSLQVDSAQISSSAPISLLTNKQAYPTNVTQPHEDALPLNLEKTDCPDSYKADLKSVLYANHAAFIDKSGKIGKCNMQPHKIRLKPDYVPKISYPYRIAQDFKVKIQKQIDQYLKDGILQESESDWGSPAIVLQKGTKRSHKHMPVDKNPKLRLVTDYRYLNSQTIYSKIEMPRLDNLIDMVASQKPQWFSSLDIKDGYWQMTLDPQSTDLTSFLFNNRSYSYKRLPQGLNSAPSAFQRLINHVILPFRETKVIAYLDDILVLGKDEKDHLSNLHEVLQTFAKAGLKFNPAKCTFMSKEVEFLGNTFSTKGIKPSSKHIEALKTFPSPTNVKELKCWLGLVQFFKDFIPNRAALTSPLYALTKKDCQFKWTNELQKCFDTITESLISEPLLTYPDLDKEFHVFCDASFSGLGGVLTQKDKDGNFKPIAYTAKTLLHYEKSLTISELEGLAAVFVISRFECYLQSRPFHLYTDHKALSYVFKGTKKLSPKLTRWGLFLSQFNYTPHDRKRYHYASTRCSFKSTLP